MLFPPLSDKPLIVAAVMVVPLLPPMLFIDFLLISINSLSLRSRFCISINFISFSFWILNSSLLAKSISLYLLIRPFKPGPLGGFGPNGNEPKGLSQVVSLVTRL